MLCLSTRNASAKLFSWGSHLRIGCNLNIFSIPVHYKVYLYACLGFKLCKHFFLFRKELTEAQRTNKPCGKCHYYLLISKTFTEATKSNSKRKEVRNHPKEELMFANAEEEFFHEVTLIFYLKCFFFFTYHQQEMFHLKFQGSLYQDGHKYF